MQLTDVELAIVAAEAGAAVVRERYGSPSSRVEKSAGDFATDVDFTAERAIVEVLRAARPTDGIVGEEAGAVQPADSGRTWLVDPLCGTLNYAVQMPLVAVNVALRNRGVTTAAAVSDPLARELFWTDGRLAGLRRDDADEPLVPSADSALVDVNLDGPFPNGDRFRAVHLLAAPEFAASFRPRVCSTTLALTWVAAGRRAAYITDGHLRDSVHFTSGIALCEATGCVVTDLRGRPPHSGSGGLIAAADQPTHAALLALADQQFAAATSR